MAPEVGFEPTTNRLTADRSTTELLRSVVDQRLILTSVDSRENSAGLPQRVVLRFASLSSVDALEHPGWQPEPGSQSAHLALR
jgi:hypothetical protein